MKTVLFLTSAYPYFPGEQFIEDEIRYWSSQTSAKIIIAPTTNLGKARNTPEGIEVDLTLAKSCNFRAKLMGMFKAISSKLFWKEVNFVYASKGLSLRCYVQALRSASSVFRIEKALNNILEKHQGIDIIYCYWNEIPAYAAVLLKRNRLISKVFSRAHGYDVYESRRPNSYMPLKRQFIGGIDSILAISFQGKKYLEKTYNAPAHQVSVNPLGVPIPPTNSLKSGTNKLNIVSISFCVSVKQIDKIIDAIAEAALQLTSLDITWNHIGDGPLLRTLQLRAAEKLDPLEIKWNFLGTKPNSEVKRYFECNFVDVFINASQSEGVPVSIMEAMSYGVPVIAPNVGGIAELVSNEYGCLLCEFPSVSDIAEAIVRMSSKSKLNQIRAHAKQKIILDYNSDINYKALVDLITR